MKNITQIVIIFLSLFLIIVLVNENIRPKIKEQPYSSHGITVINSNEYLPLKCSWICYNNTTYCKTHHVKYLKAFYAISDPFYFGLIRILASTGNYGAANLIFLVFLFPLTILYFIIKSFNIQDEIRKLSKLKQ